VKKGRARVARRLGTNGTKDAVIRFVIKQEMLVWKAAQDRDAKEFGRLVPADALMIFQSGIIRQPEYLATMKARTVAHSEIQEIRGFMPNASTVILTYRTVRVGSYEGIEFPSTPVIESTTWIKRGRRWVAILNQETPTTR
jgi:hypothetical protein